MASQRGRSKGPATRNDEPGAASASSHARRTLPSSAAFQLEDARAGADDGEPLGIAGVIAHIDELPRPRVELPVDESQPHAQRVERQRLERDDLAHAPRSRRAPARGATSMDRSLRGRAWHSSTSPLVDLRRGDAGRRARRDSRCARTAASPCRTRSARRDSCREAGCRRRAPRPARSRRAAPGCGDRPARCERRKLSLAGFRSGRLVLLLAEQLGDQAAERDDTDDDEFLERQQQRDRAWRTDRACRRRRRR